MVNSQTSPEPILSLCIPTNGAIHTVGPVIDSIYNQMCDDALFEVIISDNAKNADLESLVKTYPHKNIRYFQSDARGFLNIVSSFQSATGEFCKLINHRATLIEGSLQKLIDTVEHNRTRKPVIYFTNGAIGEYPAEIPCKNIDELVYNLHFYCSWMAGIGIWKSDLPNLENVEFNALFPNTSILFEQRVEDSEYLLCNFKYFNQLSGVGKGCYNLFHTFAVVFPDMLKNLVERRRISQETFNKILKDLYTCLEDFYRGIVIMYRDNSFDLTGIRKSMSVYYPWYTYYKMIFNVWHGMTFREKRIVLGARKNEILAKIKTKTRKQNNE